MKALVFDKELYLDEHYPKPVPLDNEALIKITLAGICGTDHEIMRGYTPFKGILGHEFVGVVESCADKSLIGKRIVGDINISCGKCDLCKMGLPNHCLNRQTLGINNRNGVFAEYTTLPIKNLEIVPPEVSDENAVFCEPLAAAFNILDNVKITGKHKVAIIGDGKLGLLIVHAISTTGCKLDLFGKHQNKMDLVKGYCTTNHSSTLTKRSNYYDIIIECTGNESALSMAAESIRPKGTLILKSTYADTIMINPSIWVRKEIRLIGSRCGRFQIALDYLKSNNIKLTKFIDEIFDLDKWEEAFNRAFQKGSLKILLRIK